MNTKQIKLIGITEQEFDQEIYHIVADRARKKIIEMEAALQKIREFTQELLEKEDWVFMKNRNVYYNNSVKALFPHFREFTMGHCPISKGYVEETFFSDFSGFSGTLMTLEEFYSAFVKHNGWLGQRVALSFSDNYFTVDDLQYTYNINGIDSKRWGSFSKEESYHIPIHRLYGKDDRDLSDVQVLYLWFSRKLIPQTLPKVLVADYEGISDLMMESRDYFHFESDSIGFDTDKIVEDIMEGKLKTLKGEEVNVEEIESSMVENLPLTVLSEEGSKELLSKLLNCDMVRCDMESYDIKILTDPNRGHWDLWYEPKNSTKYTIKLENGFIARNPTADINYDGVIGIDFGTKSTVVVYQENTEHILLMRIGTGQISKKVETKHYENPTVMELLHLDNFMEAYLSSAGRPETKWEDLVISHTANSSMLNSSSEDYYSYFHEFKQWAADKRKQIRLKDKQGKDILLPPFSEIKENEFNPIEIYAYYIGLYINNMNNGVYLDYTMSFPVTYESSVQKKITESFERGLKRSLPLTVLQDENAMMRFRVVSSISEPAAYAICALEECYSDLEEDENIYYGIFDFGGGTTDFDYGVWREADFGERKYDYVLECFGAGGDQFLGGENLLELLAFEVFKANQDALRSERISFVLPPECKRFPGSEVLLSESQEARLNMRQLMEALRPFWERYEGYENLYVDGVIKVTLFTKEGEARVNFELCVDREMLDFVLRNRIDKGVLNFFEGLKAAFHLSGQKDIHRIDIFLAGNSSRSAIVAELFQEYIASYERTVLKAGEGMRAVEFLVHPPLGFVSPSDTGEREELREFNVPDHSLSYITKPTGKTGVAYGLIEGRPGGRVKVLLPDLPKEEDGGAKEIKFKYFIGYKKKTCFRVVSDRDIPYGKWIELYDASIADFTIYYTSLPEALTNQMSILDVNKKNCRLLSGYRDANIYYRSISPTTVEYVVAKPDGIEKGEYLEEPVSLELG